MNEQEEISSKHKERKRKTNNANSLRKLRAQPRKYKAFEMRLAGLRYRDIAAHFGVSVETAYRYVQDVLEEERPPQADVDGYRDTEIARMLAMISSIWLRAQTGDLDAINTVIRLSARIARLKGLDAPEEHEIRGKLELTLSDWLQKLMGRKNESK